MWKVERPEVSLAYVGMSTHWSGNDTRSGIVVDSENIKLSSVIPN